MAPMAGIGRKMEVTIGSVVTRSSGCMHAPYLAHDLQHILQLACYLVRNILLRAHAHETADLGARGGGRRGGTMTARTW